MTRYFQGLTTCFCLLLVSFCACVSYGQAFKLLFHHLSPNEGLSQGTNAFVYQDSKGFVWLSSTDGLNRFDGKTVKIYRAPVVKGLLDNSIVSTFFEDDKTDLWFCTYEGIHRYVRNEDRFYHYQLKDKKGVKITQDYYTFHLDGQQKLWVRTGLGAEGLLHLFNTRTKRDSILCDSIDGQRIYPVLDAQKKVSQLVCTYFNSASKNGIEVIDVQKKDRRQTFFAAPQPHLPAQKAHAAVIESDSLWWLGMDQGLIAFNPFKKTAHTYTLYRNDTIGPIYALNNLPGEYLIVNSYRLGVLIFNKKNRKFVQQIPRKPDNELGLNLQGVNAFYVDKQKNLWLSSARGGVNYSNLDKQKFEKKESLEGIASIAMFQSKDGRIWCNGKAGEVLCFEPNGIKCDTFYQQSPPSVPSRKMEYFFEDERGTLWGVCNNFLFKWDAKQRVFHFSKDLPNYILYTYKLSDGTIFMSTYRGVFLFQPRNTEQNFVKAQQLGKLQAAAVTALYEDQRKRLYLAIDAKRLVITQKKNGAFIQQLTIENIGYARSFYEQADTLWVATTTGLLRVNTRDLSWERLNEQKHGVPNEHYYCVLPDASGNLWLSCNQGIICYNPVQKKYRRYTLYDGLQDNEFNRNAFLRRSDGELWLGGNNGVNVFRPDQLKNVPHRPKIQFTRLLINDEAYETPIQVEQLQSLVLPFVKNTISLDFVAMEYSDSRNNLCAYKLENYDQDWVAASNHGFARYANLPPGYYTFKVKAANSDGVWNETPKTLKIHILTPWWRTWWFYLLCISTITAIAYGIFNYRLQQALKIERIRVRISSDLHDDVGTLLSGLAMQSEILELTAPEKTKPKLQRISELSRSAMSRMRDTVWAIDARKDKLENLIDRMREHAEETLIPKDILLALEVDQLALSKNIPSQIRQALYLIYKEAITNCAKHSKGDKVSVRLQKFGPKGLEMSIHDNGEVQQKAYQTTGLGMSNMRMRAEQVGGTFQVDTSQGFLITVQIPHFS